MTDLLSFLKTLRRPRLLVRAARFGVGDYNRSRDLRRWIKDSNLPSPGQAIARLLSEESVLEEKRVAGDAGYSIARHVELLIALIGEARLVQARRNSNA